MTPHLRPLLLAASALGLLGASLPSQAALPSDTVEARNFAFDPALVVGNVEELITFRAVQGCHAVVIGIATAGWVPIEDDGGQECPRDPAVPDENLTSATDGIIFQFTLFSSGVIEYFCSVPGHRLLGMEGAIVVR